MAPCERSDCSTDGTQEYLKRDRHGDRVHGLHAPNPWVTIEENRFHFEPENVAEVASVRCRIDEVRISYAGRTYDEGKKIRWSDGVRALRCIVKYFRARRSGPVVLRP